MSDAILFNPYYKSAEDFWSQHYSYTGQHQFINDGDGNWRIKFLTSGTLTVTNDADIDVFLVGGGGGGVPYKGHTSDVGGNGGGGGYTKTVKNLKLVDGNSYQITIGAGGIGNGSNGGASSAFGQSVAGGRGGYQGTDGGSDGGSGGGLHNKGGTNGGNGSGLSFNGGYGQGSTTKEFGESTGKLYAGGGGGCVPGGTSYAGGDGTAGNGEWVWTTYAGSGKVNTGGGGGGHRRAGYCGNGGSGIVVIRKAK